MRQSTAWLVVGAFLVGIALGAGGLLYVARAGHLNLAASASPSSSASASPAPSLASDPVFSPLRKHRLTLPNLGAGAPCPVSPVKQVPYGAFMFDAYSGIGEPWNTLLASDPFYTTGIPYTDPKLAQYNYVFLVVTSFYTGPLVVRAERIDGGKPVGFSRPFRAGYWVRASYGVFGGSEDMNLPLSITTKDKTGQTLGWYPELDLPALPPQAAPVASDGRTAELIGIVNSSRIWKIQLSDMGPGCYGLQMDGTNISQTLLFYPGAPIS